MTLTLLHLNPVPKTATMVLFIIAGVMSMGVAIYAPATAISAVTNMARSESKQTVLILY